MPEVAEVSAFSLRRRSSLPVEVKFLKQSELRRRGLYSRSGDPLASTEFTYTRFLTPHLCPDADIAIFADNDFLWLGDIAELVASLDPQHAVSCVKHDYAPPEKTKMDGRTQSLYPRKNWSSLMVFNMKDPRLSALTLDRANTETGAYLHRMQWVPDEAIGAIDPRWNWLEGTPEPEGGPFAIHFTRGGPWFTEWRDVAHADRWRDEHEAWRVSADGMECASA
ncbi:glycosyltransferase [Parvibaculum sp. MBR-TMA-1.3b-4.2]